MGHGRGELTRPGESLQPVREFPIVFEPQLIDGLARLGHERDDGRVGEVQIWATDVWGDGRSGSGKTPGAEVSTALTGDLNG